MKPLNLNLDLGNVSTDMPRFATGKYLARIHKAEVAENSRGDGHNLVVSFQPISDDAVDQNGDAIKPGTLTVTAWYPLQPWDDTEAYLRNLAILLDAVFKGKRPVLTHENIGDICASMVQEEVIISVRLKDGDRGLQNDVTHVAAVG